MRREGRQQGGSILLMVLVLTAMVIVFLVSGVLLSGRQYNATVEQEEEERAFHVAEAGVHYTLYLLNSEIYVEDGFSLVQKGNLPPREVYNHDTGKLLGTHSLLFTLLPGEVFADKGLMVYSFGKDARSEKCQFIRAEIERVSGLQTVYAVAEWDHLATLRDCNLPTS